MSVEKIPVGVLAATGSVGQRFVQLLDRHPWFKVVAITGSNRKIGRPYGEACHWVLADPMPAWAQSMPLSESTPDAIDVPLVFSALPSTAAADIEPAFARAGVAVCSNASAHRSAPDVPILMPEVNPDHTALVPVQRQNRGWSGCIVTNSNCTCAGLTVTIKALNDAIGVRRAFVVSLQALSGAGYPGVASIDIHDNVIPYIASEEEKVEWEPRKMLGALENGSVQLADLQISVHANRVAVSDGHLVCLSLELAEQIAVDEAARILDTYEAPDISQSLPFTPEPVILVQDEPDRPQPRLDRLRGSGMTTVVGRIRPDPLFHLKMVVLSHNTIRGAAGGSIYNAELLVKQELIG